ncbi:hypothetical protein Ppa06_66840 [Planomonospora parontospora subsp. parontospora]|uniref:Uncharacterized protein n=2 Tax=Planomonospora parontospora TaxID=58119 RepID=A0AA37BNF1_9ACTN|nr:hypothetical protein GCM10010126_67520 [Planomonospora parontospora]GII12886.1 hypothetical protein Ppa06_66840 [Planomonospora parontospora subsp. parontospora]
MPAARAMRLVVTAAPYSATSGSVVATIIALRSSILIAGARRRVGVCVMHFIIRSEYSLRQWINADRAGRTVVRRAVTGTAEGAGILSLTASSRARNTPGRGRR